MFNCTFFGVKTQPVEGANHEHDVNGVIDVSVPGEVFAMHTRTVSPYCQVTLDGEEAQLSDLRRGDVIGLDGQPAVRLVARRP